MFIKENIGQDGNLSVIHTVYIPISVQPRVINFSGLKKEKRAPSNLPVMQACLKLPSNFKRYMKLRIDSEDGSSNLRD